MRVGLPRHLVSIHVGPGVQETGGPCGEPYKDVQRVIDKALQQ